MYCLLMLPWKFLPEREQVTGLQKICPALKSRGRLHFVPSSLRASRNSAKSQRRLFSCRRPSPLMAHEVWVSCQLPVSPHPTFPVCLRAEVICVCECDMCKTGIFPLCRHEDLTVNCSRLNKIHSGCVACASWICD